MIGHPLPVASTRGCCNFLGASLRLILVLLASVFLSGCLSKRSTYDVPEVALPSSFKNQQAEKSDSAAEKKDALVSAHEDASLVEWWHYFGSRELDGLINRGLANNPDVRIATIQLSQAKARADQAKAGLLPNLAVPATIARQAPGGTTVGSVPVGSSAKAPATSIQTSLRGDYRLDIWGEQSALADSAQMQLWRAAFERDNVQRNVTAAIAANYVEFVALNDRLRIAKETERALSETLLSVERRLALGDATVGDLEQQKAVVYGLRAAIPGMQQQREDAINTLAFMVGTLPGNLSLSDQGLDSLTAPEIVPGLPSSLLLRRPDVRMVEARLVAADADIDVARARILPPVDLAAQAGYSSNMLAQLFLPKAFFWSTVASLSASIFDAGKRENEKKYSEAVHEEMVETYIRVIYQAMREVEGSLATIRLAGKRLDAQRDAAIAARRAWEINSKVYAMGGADHLALLESERTFHRYQDDYQRAQMESYRGYISLFQALGGGVKPGAVLPGKGARPSASLNAALMGGAAVNLPEKAFSVDGLDWQTGGFAGLGGSQVENFWQIELPGLYHRSTVGAAWRDLRERYPKFMNGRILRPRLSGRIEEAGDGQEAWYRLYVAKFVKEAEANAFCQQLISQQERCKVVYSRPDERPPVELEAKEAVATTEAAVDVLDAEDLTSDKVAVLSVNASGAVDEQNSAQMPSEAKGQAGFTIQLGAFSSLENAEISSAVWQFRGYPTYVSESKSVDGRNWYSVRTGAFKLRPEGALVAQRIRRKEAVPAVLIPAVVDPLLPETTKEFTKLPSRYSVQLGAFTHIENAAKSFVEWQLRGYEPYVCETDDVKGKLRFAVRTGEFAEKHEAQQMVRLIQRQDGLRGVLVPTIVDKLGALIKIDVTPLLPHLTLDSLPPVEELSANDVR
jgi:NodT family efflux transporter outer membrane factor (OMF) lipoprotein